MTRFEKRFSSLPLLFFFFFLYLSFFPLHRRSAKRENEPAAMGTTRATVFRALLRRRSDRSTICANIILQTRDREWRKAGGLHEARRQPRRKSARSYGIACRERVAFAEFAACATPRPAVVAACKFPATTASASASCEVGHTWPENIDESDEKLRNVSAIVSTTDVSQGDYAIVKRY